jgi:chromosome partitioning protein
MAAIMKSILIANPKGGVGKTTLAVNLSGWLASRGASVMLGDIDRLQLSRKWLALRSPALPFIAGWDIDDDRPARPPKGTTHAVLDSPAGLHGKRLSQAIKQVDRVLVPLQASMFDILATRRFFDQLREEKSVSTGDTQVAVIGMRIDARTRAAAELERFLDETGLPVVAYLRDAQNYVQSIAYGMSIFDLSASRASKDWDQWQPLLAWVEPTLHQAWAADLNPDPRDESSA